MNKKIIAGLFLHFSFLAICFSGIVSAQNSDPVISSYSVDSNFKHHIYLIPGLAADERSMYFLQLDTTRFEVHYMHWLIPDSADNMRTFAARMAEQIDTSEPFSLVGVSLGGMVSVEMSEFLNPEKVVVVASAKSRKELPLRYRFQKTIPLHRLVSDTFYWKSVFIAQPIVEPDRRHVKSTCLAMLNDKNPTFMKRAVGLIVEWDRWDYDSSIITIHGSRDHTLPIRNVDYTYRIKKGSHMMIMTKANEISEILNAELDSE
ncbi:MAG: alpha/beta hydrolase [Bacteroidetes bacterium]|nr:alpha/beta hydrolase [Bacteroidota bacterium]